MRALCRRSLGHHCLSSRPYRPSPPQQPCFNRLSPRRQASAAVLTPVLDRVDHKHIPEADASSEDAPQAATTSASRPSATRPRAKLHLPSKATRNSPAAWLSVVEPYLPLRLKSAHPRWPLHVNHQDASLEDLPEVILRAKKDVDLDIPLHMALTQDRWDAMLWIFDVILQLSKSETPAVDDRAILRSIRYPSTQYLDSLTNERLGLTGVRLPDQPLAPSPLPSLDAFTLNPLSTAHVASWTERQSHVGLLWMSAVKLLLSAKTKNDGRAEKKIRYALRLLGQLHFHGYIPPKVYNDPSEDGELGIRQPAMISETMDSIMSALFDAAVHSGDDTQESVLIRLDLRIEVWIEFILWCCVRGGWLLEAASILRMLQSQRATKHGLTWHLQSFTPSTPPSSKPKHPAWARAVARSSDFPANTNSAEVVAALFDAMLSSLRSTPLQLDSLDTLLPHLFDLQKFLNRERVPWRSLSRYELLARMADVPQDVIYRDTRCMLRLLQAFQPSYGPKSKSGTQDDSWGNLAEKESIIVLTLYHRLLRTHVGNDDSRSTLHVLRALVEFTGRNLQFVTEGKWSALKLKFNRRNTIFDASLPPGLLADMLDMFVKDQMLDVCRWLLRSSDPGGPLIDPDLYGEARLVPPLLRFAIADGDKRLLVKLSHSESSTDTARLLVSVIESRLNDRKWDLAQSALESVREYPDSQWDDAPIAILLRALLPSVADVENEGDAIAAANLLRLLLGGAFGTLWGPKPSYVGTIIFLLASADRMLGKICADLVDPGLVSQVSLSRRDFDMILEGLVAGFGSATGRRVWRIWCGNPSSTSSVPWAAQTNSMRQLPKFSTLQSDEAPARGSVMIQNGTMGPAVSTMRIIINQAQWERSNVRSPKESALASALLVWARVEMQRRLKVGRTEAKMMTDAPILSNEQARQVRPPHSTDAGLPYSALTMELWLKLVRIMGSWLEETERRMREFATADDAEEVELDDMTPSRRAFVHELAVDLKLFGEDVGHGSYRSVRLFKTQDGAQSVPPKRLVDVFGGRPPEAVEKRLI